MRLKRVRVLNSLIFSKQSDCHFLKLQLNSYLAQSIFNDKQQLQKAEVRRLKFPFPYFLQYYASHVQLAT